MTRNRSLFLPLLTTIVVSVLAAGLAAARAETGVVLKPRGREAAPLRLKAMAARVRLDASQFAATDLDLTFQNEQSERIEADFLYTVPDGAVVTDFAYFYEDERVPARIAEKERAAAIYQHITSRMRDPALVEMIGKNTFRARIFPVLPDADLRVQIRYIQALPVGAGNTVTYSLPLKASKSDRLDRVSVDIHGSRPAETTSPANTSLVNNFGLPFRRGGAGEWRLSFSGSHYRANRDLRITRTLPKVPLLANGIAARSGGPDGFFALALAGPAGTPRLRASGLRIDGVSSYAVETRPSGAGLLVTGRYRGSGSATVTVADAAGTPLPRARLEFGRKAEANNSASKLWAAARIARLSVHARDRAAVVGLSRRFCLPSRWTSWIAIPKEERERYHRERAEADADIIAGRLARLIERGKGDSAAARRLRTEFRRVYPRLEDEAANAEASLRSRLEAYLQDSVDQAAQDVARAVAAGAETAPASRRARARLNHLCRLTGQSPATFLRYALDNEHWRYTERMVELVARGEDETPAGRLAWRRYRTLSKASRLDTETRFRQSVNQKIEGLAARWVRNEHGTTGDLTWDQQTGYEKPYEIPVPRLSAPRRAALKARLTNLARAARRDLADVIEEAETPYRTGEMFRLRNRIVAARKQEPLNPSRLNGLEARFLAEARSARQKRVAEQKRHYYRTNTPEQRETFARDRLARIAARTEGERIDLLLQAAPSDRDRATLRARREALKQREEELRVRMGDPLVSVEAPADARAVVARMPDGAILPLTWNAAAGRWQARFDVPTTATEGVYVVNVTVLRRDNTRHSTTFRYVVDVTAPEGVARVTRLDRDTLRLAVEATPDTARILALLPGDRAVTLRAEAGRPGRFFALVPAALTPGDTVTFILTDRAHNRTTLTAALSEARP